jgi:hypothetical protein
MICKKFHDNPEDNNISHFWSRPNFSGTRDHFSNHLRRDLLLLKFSKGGYFKKYLLV